MPPLSAAAETRDTWAMVARGAVKDVSVAKEAASVSEVRLGDERLEFSFRGAFEGET